MGPFFFTNIRPPGSSLLNLTQVCPVAKSEINQISFSYLLPSTDQFEEISSLLINICTSINIAVACKNRSWDLCHHTKRRLRLQKPSQVFFIYDPSYRLTPLKTPDNWGVNDLGPPGPNFLYPPMPCTLTRPGWTGVSQAFFWYDNEKDHWARFAWHGSFAEVSMINSSNCKSMETDLQEFTAFMWPFYWRNVIYLLHNNSLVTIGIQSLNRHPIHTFWL